MVRLAGQTRRYKKNLRAESARVGRCLKYHRSGRVGSGRAGSGRVGSGGFKYHGSGWVALTRSDWYGMVYRENIRTVKNPAFLEQSCLGVLDAFLQEWKD